MANRRRYESIRNCHCHGLPLLVVGYRAQTATRRKQTSNGDNYLYVQFQSHPACIVGIVELFVELSCDFPCPTLYRDMALPTDPTLERTLRGHRGTITSVAWASNNRQLASGGADHTVMVWNFKPTLRAFRFVGHTVGAGTRDVNRRPDPICHSVEADHRTPSSTVSIYGLAGACAMRWIFSRWHAPRLWLEGQHSSVVDAHSVSTRARSAYPRSTSSIAREVVMVSPVRVAYLLAMLLPGLPNRPNHFAPTAAVRACPAGAATPRA